MHSLFALADERSLPVLIHAGRGIPALGAHAVQLAGEFPDARLILAHAGISDLSWIWRVAADHPNLLFDTAWWMPADLLTLFSLVPPGQILFASDAPYGSTVASAAFQLRCALEAGLSAEQIRCIGSEQSLRIAAGEPLEPCGPAVGERERAPHALLDRVAEFLMLGAIATIRANDGGRRCSRSPGSLATCPTRSTTRRCSPRSATLLDHFDRLADRPRCDRRRLAFLIMAATVARTPDVPVPPGVAA